MRGEPRQLRSTPRGCAEERREEEIYARYLLAVKPDAGAWNELAARIERERPVARVIRFRDCVTRVVDETRARVALPAAAAVLLMMGGALLVATFTARREVAPAEEMTARVIGDATDNPNVRQHEVPNAQGMPNEIVSVPNVKEPDRTRVIFASGGDERRTPRGTLRHGATKNAPRRASSRAIDGETPHMVVSEAESQHLEAIALLKRDIATRSGESTLEGTTRYDEALGAIDKVIDDTRRVVRGNPNDPIAVQHLAKLVTICSKRATCACRNPTWPCQCSIGHLSLSDGYEIIDNASISQKQVANRNTIHCKPKVSRHRQTEIRQWEST